MTNLNERMNALLYKKYLLHFIRKGWCWLCMRGELETGTDCHVLTQTSSDHSSTSSAFWLGCSTVGHWGSASWFSRWYIVPNWIQLRLEVNWLELQLTQAVCGTWLYNCLTSTCFLWAYASAPNSTTSTGQGDIPISSTGCTCFAVLPLIFTDASLDWRLGRGSICYISPSLAIFNSSRMQSHQFVAWSIDTDVFLLFFFFVFRFYCFTDCPQFNISVTGCCN